MVVLVLGATIFRVQHAYLIAAAFVDLADFVDDGCRGFTYTNH